MIQRILVPLDGSSLAETTVRYALALSRAFGSEVILLRVVEPEPDRPGLLSGSMEWRLAESEAQCYLSSVAARFRKAGVEPEVDVDSGTASDEIVDAVRRWDADLVVLARHGNGNAFTFPQGGTTGKVISSADASFLLIPVPEGGRHVGFSLERVIVPMDGSPRGEWALNLAASVAKASGATLLLAYVTPRPEVLRVSGAPSEGMRLAERLVEENRSQGLRYLEEKKSQISSPDLPVEIQVLVASSVPRAIHGLAASEPGSLLVLSAHGRSADPSWSYGGVASTLLAHGAVPILVFQDLPRRRPHRRSRAAGRYAWRPEGSPA